MSIVSINTDANISQVNLHKELEIINGKLNDEIILNNRSLKKQISELIIEKNDMEIQMPNLNQYTRRSNMISNISEKLFSEILKRMF